jgi:hypothetical protein
MVRAAVDALDESLDGDPGPDLQALDTHERLWIDERSAGTRRLMTAP